MNPASWLPLANMHTMFSTQVHEQTNVPLYPLRLACSGRAPWEGGKCGKGEQSITSLILFTLFLSRWRSCFDTSVHIIPRCLFKLVRVVSISFALRGKNGIEHTYPYHLVRVIPHMIYSEPYPRAYYFIWLRANVSHELYFYRPLSGGRSRTHFVTKELTKRQMSHLETQDAISA